jgi:hypothetical protein
VAPIFFVVSAAWAADGVREINQASVSGNVTTLHVIRDPGSYRLTSDLVAPSGQRGITIDADGEVTLDLNGFTLSSLSAPGSGPYHGVLSGSSHNIEIRNGTIRGFPGSGIYLVSGALENGTEGIRIEGTTNAGSIVRGCTASRNLVSGILVLGAHSMVTDNVAAANGSYGLQLAADVGYADNVVGGNGLSQISGGDAIGCNLVGGTPVCPP